MKPFAQNPRIPHLTRFQVSPYNGPQRLRDLPVPHPCPPLPAPLQEHGRPAVPEHTPRDPASGPQPTALECSAGNSSSLDDRVFV